MKIFALYRQTGRYTGRSAGIPAQTGGPAGIPVDRYTGRSGPVRSGPVRYGKSCTGCTSALDGGLDIVWTN